MSSYFPPTQDLAIFDPSVFKKQTDALTIQEADSRYLRFPTAQGTENFTNINVFGDASFNLDVSVAGTLTAGTLNISNLAVNSMDVGTGGIDCSGNLLVVDYTGSQQDTEMVVFANPATTGKLGIVMNPQPANYNPIVRADDTIMSFGQNNGAFANFCISPWSLTACGLRVTKDNLLIGAGGTTTPGNPINPTQNIFIDGSNNRITITSNDLRVDGAMNMIASSGNNRAIYNTYYNMKTADTNSVIGSIYSSGSNFLYDNNANSGNHTFATNTSGGVQTTPLVFDSSTMTITENDLTLTTTNPPTCSAVQPALTDSSTKIPTTAWVQGAINLSSSTATFTYTTNQSVVIPSGTRFIDILCMGRGGNAGSPNVGPPILNYGGTGSGGNCIWANGIPMSAGETLTLTFTSAITAYPANSTGYTDVSYLGNTLCRAYNGNNGQDGISGGLGASPNTTPSLQDTTFGVWTSARGVIGSNGGSNTIPNMSAPTIACPKGTSIWSAGKSGCGQRDTSTAVGLGVVVITFHKT